MSDPGLTPSTTRDQHAERIREADTFRTLGVGQQQARNFLRTPEGVAYLEQVIRADPGADIDALRVRAINQIMSGRELPRMEMIEEPLVKIVPRGDVVSPYSPFFARHSAFDDAIARGLNLSDHFALPIRSEAQVYDVYQIRPNGPSQVFANTVAPTSELGGLVTKPGSAEQLLVPNRSLFDQPVRIGSIGNDLALHDELVAGRGLGASITALGDEAAERMRAPRLAGVGRTLGVASLALELYDGAQTYRSITRLRGEGNDTAAESELIHFGSRSIGGLGGAAVGAGVGGAAASWSGPGMLIGGTLGGIVGVFGGEKFAEWTDNRRIYNQEDGSGNTWTFDPEQPRGGWRRDAPIDATNDGLDNARRGGVRASPATTSQLDYQATSTSVALILGSPPPQRDPFTQPSNAQDTPSSQPSSWTSDPGTGQWSRRVYGPFVERGMTPYRDESASSARAAELDRAAAQVVVENASNSPASIAARYEDAYIRNEWARFGPQPDAVRNARTDIDTLVASDANRYQRQADGRWVSDGMFYDSTAGGALQAELNASRAVLQARLPPPREIVTPPPMTEQERLQDAVAGAYLNAGIDASPERIAAAAVAVRATWDANALDPGTTALVIRPDVTGRYGLDSPIGSMRLEADGRTYRIAATTGIEQIQAAETARPQTEQRSTVVDPSEANADPRIRVPAPAQAPPQATRRDASLSETAPETRSAALLADQPSHPDHATFNRIHCGVLGTGQWDQEKSRNVASALYREQAADPLMQRVDRVAGAMGRNGEQNVFAVYAPFGDGGPFLRASVDGREAAQQPAQQNLEQAEQARQQLARQQSQEQDQPLQRGPQVA